MDSPLRASVEGTAPPPVAADVPEVALPIQGTRVRASANGIVPRPACMEDMPKVSRQP